MGDRYYIKRLAWDNGDLVITLYDSRDNVEKDYRFTAAEIWGTLVSAQPEAEQAENSGGVARGQGTANSESAPALCASCRHYGNICRPLNNVVVACIAYSRS
jgi:hypothetical protein